MRLGAEFAQHLECRAALPHRFLRVQELYQQRQENLALSWLQRTTNKSFLRPVSLQNASCVLSIQSSFLRTWPAPVHMSLFPAKLQAKSLWNTHHQCIVVCDQHSDNAQESHHDGKVRLFIGWGRSGHRHALAVLETGREQFDDQRADTLLQQKAELQVLERARGTFHGRSRAAVRRGCVLGVSR